jgi:5-hydroxyisourate hydrolase
VSPITCHVLDTSLGRPVRGLSVQLAVLEPDQRWVVLATRTTDADGRVTDLLTQGDLQARMYRLIFDTGSYLAASGQKAFYPEVVVTFSHLPRKLRHPCPRQPCPSSTKHAPSSKR